MFGRIVTIAGNAFREAVRDRVLYNLVLFVLLLIGAAVFIGELSGGQERKIIVDLGLSAMLLFGVFIAIFVGVGLVYKEIERRTVYAIFAKPVSRGDFSGVSIMFFRTLPILASLHRQPTDRCLLLLRL